MKVAVLILAHKNAEQLKRLISVLQHPSVDIFIHLDKKSNLSPSDFQEYDVYFTEKRIDVGLFEFSMVDAEIELLRTAMSHKRYGYYLLLSGQCYPLRHIDNIYDYLCRSYPKPLIEVISPEIVTMFSHVFRYAYTMKKFRNSSEVFLKKWLSTDSIYPYKYIPEVIVRGASMVKSALVKSPKRRLKNMGIEPYFGSQWWILPDVVIDDILVFYDNKDFCNCISDCISCDETFFQTAIMTQAKRFGIALNEKGYYPNKKWFAIFSHNHPILLSKRHFNQIISSTKLFARKFDIDMDSDILNLIDAHCLEQRNEEIQDG